VGYHVEPARDPAVADYGAAFAERLRAALSNSARDERLYRQAHYDPLTQLPNRALFRDRLAQELAAAATGLTRGALLYVDLDHFKRVNDRLGHSAGDQLLSIVAHRLKTCTKEGDTVARLGGDEFTVLLRNVGDAETARQIADRVVRSLALPASLGGRDYQMRASVGVTLFPDDGTELDDVIRQSDLAMYRAKAQGRGRAVFFEREMKEQRPSFTDSGLHRALRRREFGLYYQPQFSLADLAGRVVKSDTLSARTVVVNFWGTWCGPCVAEMPELQQFYDKYRDDPTVAIFTISNDKDLNELRDWMSKRRLTIPTLFDDGYVEKLAEIHAFPTTWFIDKDGKVQFTAVGNTGALMEEWGWRLEATKAGPVIQP